MPGRIIVITGPTATGKTALGVALAERINGEVVSADSMQIYKYMNIGTAKPSLSEMHGIPHHMFDVVSPFENYSVARYVDEASKCVDSIISRGKLPILVGGTGLYIESLLSGRNFAAESDYKLREELSLRYNRDGGQKMLSDMSKFDPESAKKLHYNDKKRIIRAFEVFLSSGKTISEHNQDTKSLPPRYSAAVIALSFSNRSDLYERINRRVDIMIQQGLPDEVRGLLDMGLTPEHTAMQAIGYKELVLALNGAISLDEAIEKIKMESRRYAKRQLSWLRRDKNIHWILWEKTPDIDSGVHDSTVFLEENSYNMAVDR